MSPTAVNTASAVSEANSLAIEAWVRQGWPASLRAAADSTIWRAASSRVARSARRKPICGPVIRVAPVPNGPLPLPPPVWKENRLSGWTPVWKMLFGIDGSASWKP